MLFLPAGGGAAQLRPAAPVSEAWRAHLLYLLLLCLMMTPACGFRMGDSRQLPAGMEETGLLGGSRDLYRELRQGFTAAGAVLHREASGGAGLRILEGRFDRRILSVDAAGKVLEYELLYTLEFDAIGADGEVLLRPQRLQLVRDYLYAGDVYGASHRERLLREQMHREMARLILWRIQAQAR